MKIKEEKKSVMKAMRVKPTLYAKFKNKCNCSLENCPLISKHINKGKGVE